MNLEASYPDTPEKRRAGMARFRARLLAAKQRALADGVAYTNSGKVRPLTAAERAAVAQDIEAIKAAQVRFGEVSE